MGNEEFPMNSSLFLLSLFFFGAAFKILAFSSAAPKS